MPDLDLYDDEAATLVALLTRSVANDRYPSSPLLRALSDIPSELDTKPAA